MKEVAITKKTKKSFLRSFFRGLFFSRTEAAKEIIALDKTIKWLIYILAFLMPLWFLPITVNVLEFNKQALMILLVVVTLILWLIKILNQGEVHWKGGIFNFLLGIFLIIVILSTIFSIRSYGSLVGWPTHLSSGLINVLVFLAMYFLIINNFKGLKETFGLLFVFLGSSAIAIVYGFLQIWGEFILPWDFTKIASFNTIGTVNSLGIFSAIILTLAISLLFVIKRSGLRMFLILLSLLSLIILISLNFWVLWLILAMGMAVILVFGLMQMVKLEESIGWVVLPMAVLAIALIFMLFRPIMPLSPNLPAEVGLSYRGGLNIVKEVVKENPVLGTGPETFVFNYLKYKPETINQTAFWNIRFSNPPSEIMSIVSDLGILGLVSFLIILILFTVKAIKNLMKTTQEGENILKRFLEIGLFAGWFGLAVAWFIYPQNFTLMFVFWLLLAIYLAESSVFKNKVYNLKQSSRVLLLASFAFVIMIVIIVGFLYIGGTRYVAEAKYKTGLDLIQNQGKLDEGINKVIKATVINPYEDKNYRVLSQLFIFKMNQDARLEGLDQQQRLNLVQVDAINAINSAVRATTLSPNDVSNWLVRGQVYSQVMSLVSGAGDWAISSYEKAITLEPLNPFTFTEWGRVYAQADEEEMALEKYNKALEIKPDYAPAHFESALIFDQLGKLPEAIAGMTTNMQINPTSGNAFQLGVLYYKAEKYDQAKNAFIWAIGQDPDFSNARYFLGLLYDREGNKEDALEQFERIAVLNPDNEHVKDIIANLNAGLPALGSPELGPPDQPEEIPIEKEPKEE